MTSDDRPSVRPIPPGEDDERVAWPSVRPIPPSEDDEKVAPGDSRSGDRADKPAGKWPWSFIGRRFIEGIPFIKKNR
ncbi:MAG: hypothetical protein IH941_11720 [Acidobacteria bacterium]|nr:hypothetical protein [Acidobacteriota bacterium]